MKDEENKNDAFKEKMEKLKNSKEYKEANEITKTEFKLALHLRMQLKGLDYNEARDA